MALFSSAVGSVQKLKGSVRKFQDKLAKIDEAIVEERHDLRLRLMRGENVVQDVVLIRDMGGALGSVKRLGQVAQELPGGTYDKGWGVG